MGTSNLNRAPFLGDNCIIHAVDTTSLNRFQSKIISEISWINP